MHPQIFINIWFSFVFPLSLKRSVGDTSKFSVLRREKMYKTKTTEWHDELKPTENELKMKICLLILYLNRSNLLILRSAAATPMPHPPDKINCTKDVLFFILRAPNHHIFTFNLWFLFKLNHKVCLPKTVCGIFQFRFCLVFIKVYIFVQQNAWTLNSG